LILSNILFTLPLVLAVIALLTFLFRRLFKNKNSTDIILFGMGMTIAGEILLISDKIDFAGSGAVALILVFAGIGLSLAGLFK
jgi:hypothetical protein